MQTFPINHVPAFKKIIGFSFIAFIVLFFASCKKGDTGPAGPAGTANVTYSDWFTPSTYTISTVFGLKNFDYRKTAPGITQVISDSGAVLTYGKLSGYNTAIWPTGSVSLMPIAILFREGFSALYRSVSSSCAWSSFVTMYKIWSE